MESRPLNDLLYSELRDMNQFEASRFRAILAESLPGFIEQAAKAARNREVIIIRLTPSEAGGDIDKQQEEV